MIIEYNVECFERTLVIRCPKSYVEHVTHILELLDKYYFEWHSPEEVEDDDDRAWLMADACCEEYMMSKVQALYPECEEWDSFYYGNNEEEIAEDNEKHRNDHRWNIHWLNKTLEQLYDRKEEFDEFEKLGNEAYHIVAECIEKLEELKEQYVKEEM